MNNIEKLKPDTWYWVREGGDSWYPVLVNSDGEFASAGLLTPVEFLFKYPFTDVVEATLPDSDKVLMPVDKEKSIDEIIDSQCWSVVCESCSHGDDSSINWLVIGYFMDKPYERVIGFASELQGSKGAVKNALKTIENDAYAYLHEYKK